MTPTSTLCPCCNRAADIGDAPNWNALLGTIYRFGVFVVLPAHYADVFDLLWRYRRYGYITSAEIAEELYGEFGPRPRQRSQKGCVNSTIKLLSPMLKAVGVGIESQRGPNGGYRIIIENRGGKSEDQDNSVGRQADHSAGSLQPHTPRHISRPKSPRWAERVIKRAPHDLQRK